MKTPKKNSRIISRRKGQLKSMRYQSRDARIGGFVDLSDYEEAPDRSFFIKIGLSAANNAVNENKAMRIPITFFLDGWIVRRMPSGQIEKVYEVTQGKINKKRRIAKGTILHVSRSAR